MGLKRNDLTQRRRPARLRHRSRSWNGRRLQFEALDSRELLAVVATLRLETPVIQGTVAHLDVSLDFAATAGERLAYFSLDVEPSSDSLIGPGPDYSAFSFTKASPLLDDWTEIGFFNDLGFESTVEFDDSLVASLPSGNYELGTLTVDFGAAGLSLNDSFTVAINGQGTVIGVDDPQQGFEFRAVSFNPASQTVTPVRLNGAAAVDEGSSYTLTIQAPAGFTGSYLIQWGDGQEQTIPSGDLPANGEVTHTYLDGPLSPAIAVDLVDGNGNHTPAGTLAVTVNNVVPNLSLSGPATVNEGALYTLTIGAVTDPGADTASQYVIRWGDGQQQTINAVVLPTERTVTHTYTDGPLVPTIELDLVDEDGTHAAVDSLALTVTNVAPSVSLSGPATVNEGDLYTLTIGPVTDPGADSVSQYLIDWGDGQQQTINAVDLQTARTVTHTYTDGPLVPTIELDLVDEDGTHASVDTLTVTVANVVPNVTLSGPATVNEGAPYTVTIGPVNDPGADTVSQYIIRWGDGQQQTINAADLHPARTVTHTYPDGPLSPTITMDLVDEDGTHSTVATLNISVANVVPTITLSGPATVEEGSPYILTIDGVDDPINSAVNRLFIDWGDGPPETIDVDDIPEDGTIVHTYGAGPISVTILVDLIDDQSVVLARLTRRVDVLDDGLVLDRFDTTASVPGETARNAVVFVTGEFTDLGAPEPHTAIIDWGDGSPLEPVDVTQTNGSISVTSTHQFETGGVFTLTLTVADPDGTTITAVTRAYVTGFRVVNGILQIVGSEGNDIVTVTPQSDHGLFVNITLPGVGNLRSSLDRATVQGIDVYVGAGNDRVMVSERLTIVTYLDGGPDDDHVQGGDGSNIVLGGPGKDMILGGTDRDILVGGEGQNLLLGYGDDDLLIGGSWQNVDEVRLQSFDVWNSSVPFAVRQTMISELLDLTADVDPDALFGGDGENLFYASEWDVAEVDKLHTPHSIEELIARGWSQPPQQWAGLFTVARTSNAHSTVFVEDPSAQLIIQPAPNAEPESQSAADFHDTLSDSPRDVNRDGFVTPQDVMVVINALNSDRGGQVTEDSQYLDSNRDGWITPLDALGTVNFLNALANAPSAEGDSSGSVIAVTPGSPESLDDRAYVTWRSLQQALARDVRWEDFCTHHAEIAKQMQSVSSDVVSLPDRKSDLEKLLDEIAADIARSLRLMGVVADQPFGR